jgi:nucleoside-diphosphate-sugar epimerase
MILLTGSSGFIGKHLLKSLIKKYGKENILVLTSKPIDDCTYLLHNNYNFGKDFFIESGYSNIDTIIHAGAFTPKSSKEGNNILKSNSNIKNTTQIITSDLPQLKKFIFLSTLDVYGADIPIREDSLLAPISLYGQSKLYCEELLKVWANQNNIIYQTLRIGHVYGPGEEEYKKIIPITINNIFQSQPVNIYGEGKEIRSFIYIFDVVEAILNSILLDTSIGIINIVGHEQININDLIQKIVLISEKTTEIKRIETNSSGRDIVFDNKKMKEILLNPKTTLDEGLKQEIDYFKSL